MVENVQDELEEIYGLRCTLKASSYVVSDEAALQLGATGRSNEELLLCETDDGLELGLYLSNGLLNHLKSWEGAPVHRVVDEALPMFCELAEGVSHFIYVVHTAEQNRRVSLLELEAQAEVDKFALCMLARWGNTDWPQQLVHRLFDAVSFRHTLTSAERSRYEEANRLARKYCVELTSHMKRRRLDKLLNELRYSYRLGAEAKLRRFAQSP